MAEQGWTSVNRGEREPERTRRTFALQTHRVEPAGAIYLWPQGAVPQEVR